MIDQLSPNSFLNENEAAAYLRVSPEMIRRAINEGGLRAARIGRTVRIRLGDLAAFIFDDRQGGDFYSVDEVASRLRVRVGEVGNLIVAGELGAVRIAGGWRVPVESLQMFLSTSYHGPKSGGLLPQPTSELPDWNQWVELGEAAKRLSLNGGHLRRLCKLRLESEGMAMLSRPPKPKKGMRRWYLNRLYDHRLASEDGEND